MSFMSSLTILCAVPTSHRQSAANRYPTGMRFGNSGVTLVRLMVTPAKSLAGSDFSWCSGAFLRNRYHAFILRRFFQLRPLVHSSFAPRSHGPDAMHSPAFVPLSAMFL